MFDGCQDPRELPTEHLEAEVAQLYARISAETCEFLAMVAELERRKAYERAGYWTLPQWLSIHCGIGIRAAQEQVRVALRLEELPAIQAAFAEGSLTYSKARALCRIATPDSEAELLDLARKTSAAQLERVARSYRRCMPTDADPSPDWRHHASIHTDEDGSMRLQARLAPEEGALLLKAFELARSELCEERAETAREREHDPHDKSAPAAPSGADALVRVAENCLAGAAHAASGADTHQVVVHVDAELLRKGAAEPIPATAANGEALDPGREGPAAADARDGDATEATPDGRCEAEGAGISPETARRIGCDASLIATIERDGDALTVGRKTRSIPPSVRRAVSDRDRGCRFPGCTARRLVEHHHIVFWADGGETSAKNVVSLCRHHHRLVHEGGFTVQRRPDGGYLFRRPNGKPIPGCDLLPRQRPPALDRPPAALDPWVRRVGAPLAACSATCGGERMDFEHTMFVLMQRFRTEEDLRSAERSRQRHVEEVVASA
jgi:hypothetical protein